MEKDENKKLKYVPPTSQIMEFSPGCILAGSVSATNGDWSIDNGGSGTGASSGGWSIDNGGGGTGASAGGWSTDGGGGGTGASAGGWSND